MFCSAKDMRHWKVTARDGAVGKVREIYFDDARWTVRYLVVDAGGWLLGRRVLLPPSVVERLDPNGAELRVALTRQQVKDAPPVESDEPVSRQQEAAQYDYYGLPYYWAGAGIWGLGAYPPVYGGLGRAGSEARASGVDEAPAGQKDGDAHLRSSAEVTGYHIEARDGAIGHLEDLLFDAHDWQIRHAVVETRNWLPGDEVLITPKDIERIDWAQRQVHVGLTRDQVRSAREHEQVR